MSDATPVVTVLQCKTSLQLDPEPLIHIYAARGEQAASETVCRALEDMAERLNTLVITRPTADAGDLEKPARTISALAEQIGLVEVSLAAQNVANAARQGNEVAIDATIGRLERCFDLAISQVWDFQAPFLD